MRHNLLFARLFAFTENLQFCTYVVHACNPSTVFCTLHLYCSLPAFSTFATAGVVLYSSCIAVQNSHSYEIVQYTLTSRSTLRIKRLVLLLIFGTVTNAVIEYWTFVKLVYVMLRKFRAQPFLLVVELCKSLLNDTSLYTTHVNFWEINFSIRELILPVSRLYLQWAVALGCAAIPGRAGRRGKGVVTATSCSSNIATGLLG